MARTKKQDGEEMAEPIKTDTELRLEMMEKRLSEQMNQMSELSSRLEDKQKQLETWEDELKNRTNPKRNKKKEEDKEPIPMVVARFRNFKEQNAPLEFWYQEDHYRLMDNRDYCLPQKIADHLNNITKRVWQEEKNTGFMKQTETFQTQYFVQVLDSFYKDPQTGDYFKIEAIEGERTRVSFNPKEEEARQPVKVKV
jgi:hypothetical protein